MKAEWERKVETWVPWLAAAILIWCTVWAFRSCSGPVSNQGWDQDSDAGNVTGLPPGQVGVLYGPGDGDAIVAVDRESEARFTQLAAAGDREGAHDMMRAGQLIVVKAGTPVRVLDMGWDWREVRVLSGPLRGRYVFVRAGCVRRDLADNDQR